MNYYSNFINANVFVNKNDDLVYITNDNTLGDFTPIEALLPKQLKISLKNEFYKYISPFVKKEHMYFVSGENNFVPSLLLDYRGGLHCLCAEIPKFD